MRRYSSTIQTRLAPEPTRSREGGGVILVFSRYLKAVYGALPGTCRKERRPNDGADRAWCFGVSTTVELCGVCLQLRPVLWVPSIGRLGTASFSRDGHTGNRAGAQCRFQLSKEPQGAHSGERVIRGTRS